jgi:chromosome segregation ATPase
MSKVKISSESQPPVSNLAWLVGEIKRLDDRYNTLFKDTCKIEFLERRCNDLERECRDLKKVCNDLEGECRDLKRENFKLKEEIHQNTIRIIPLEVIEKHVDKRLDELDEHIENLKDHTNYISSDDEEDEDDDYSEEDEDNEKEN